MPRLLHGTSADNLHSILLYGLDPAWAPDRNWTCSLEETYFWHPLRFTDYDTYEERWEEAFRNAVESAEFCLAKAKDCRRVVIEAVVPAKDISDDDSCPNMDQAVTVQRVVKPREFSRIWVDSESLDYFKPYFAALRLQRVGDGDFGVGLDLTNAEEVIARAVMRSIDLPCILHEALNDMTEDMLELDLDQELAKLNLLAVC